MSNFSIVTEKIQKGEVVYMKDDFYEAAIRLVGDYDSFLKHRGKEEVQVPHGYEVVMDIQMGGEFISKEEYEAY